LELGVQLRPAGPCCPCACVASGRPCRAGWNPLAVCRPALQPAQSELVWRRCERLGVGAVVILVCFGSPSGCSGLALQAGCFGWPGIAFFLPLMKSLRAPSGRDQLLSSPGDRSPERRSASACNGNRLPAGRCSRICQRWRPAPPRHRCRGWSDQKPNRADSRSPRIARQAGQRRVGRGVAVVTGSRSRQARLKGTREAARAAGVRLLR